MNNFPRLALVSILMLCLPAMASGDIHGQLAREAAEFLMRRFGREAAQQGLQTLTRRIETLASRHGPGVFAAVRKVGPGALPLIEKAGEHGPQAVRLLAQFGEQSAAIVSKPQSLKLVAELGDDAARSLMRHPGIAEPLLEAHGHAAVRALEALKTANGRRLAMMLQSGELQRTGRARELLDALYGDRAMDFIWRHKGALAVTAVLTAFLVDPGSFIHGVRDVTKVLADATLRPLAEVPGRVAEEAARGTNWTIVGIVALSLLAGLLFLRHYRKRS